MSVAEAVAFDTYLERLGAFVRAQITGDARLTAVAGEVLLNSREPLTVREAVEDCRSHRWNFMIYEAWAWETANRVWGLIDSVPHLVGEAIKAYAPTRVELYVSESAAWDAIDAARREVGDPTWN